MLECVVFHAAREGTGSSLLTANVAAILAARGRRVGVVEANLHDGGLTLLFGLAEQRIKATFNDYLLERANGSATFYDVTPALPQAGGRIWLSPASSRPRDLTTLLQTGFRIERITDDLFTLAATLQLDVLLVDTHAGLQEVSLLTELSFALAQTLVLVLRLDQADYQGTGVALDVARTLKVPQIVLLANQVATAFDPVNVKQELEATYGAKVAAMLPYSTDIAAHGSAGLFVLRYPKHPLTQLLNDLTSTLSQRPNSLTT